MSGIEWTTVVPNEHGDWINQRTSTFAELVPLVSDDGLAIFEFHTHGLKTNRDAWNYNSSQGRLDSNVRRMIEFFNSQVDAFSRAERLAGGTVKERAELVKRFVDLDPTKFSWERANFSQLAQGRRLDVADRFEMVGAYRPFHRRWAEGGRKLNSVVGQLQRVFPRPDAANYVMALPPRI